MAYVVIYGPQDLSGLLSHVFVLDLYMYVQCAFSTTLIILSINSSSIFPIIITSQPNVLFSFFLLISTGFTQHCQYVHWCQETYSPLRQTTFLSLSQVYSVACFFVQEGTIVGHPVWHVSYLPCSAHVWVVKLLRFFSIFFHFFYLN